MLQMVWESFVNYGIGPLFLAALYHPVATTLTAFGFTWFAIWKAH